MKTFTKAALLSTVLTIGALSTQASAAPALFQACGVHCCGAISTTPAAAVASFWATCHPTGSSVNPTVGVFNDGQAVNNPIVTPVPAKNQTAGAMGNQPLPAAPLQADHF